VLSVDTFVFSVDDVFSYKVVDRLGISPPAGPTVRFPLLAASYLLAAVRGFAGDVEVAKNEQTRPEMSSKLAHNLATRDQLTRLTRLGGSLGLRRHGPIVLRRQAGCVFFDGRRIDCVLSFEIAATVVNVGDDCCG